MTENDLNELIVASLEAAGYDNGYDNRHEVLRVIECDVEDDSDDLVSAAIDRAIESLGDDLIEPEHENPNDEYDPCVKFD